MKCNQLLFGTVLSVVVLVYLITSAYCETYLTKRSHILTKGKRLDSDRLLVNETIRAEKSTTSSKVSKDIRYTSKSNSEIDYIISYVKVEDRGTGGLAHLKGGGPGREFVAIHLESQEGKGFEFQITIFEV